MTESELLTIGQIADRLEEPPARVAYIISKHRLKPISRVGIIRLFSETQLTVIRESISNIQIRGAHVC